MKERFKAILLHEGTDEYKPYSEFNAYGRKWWGSARVYSSY